MGLVAVDVVVARALALAALLVLAGCGAGKALPHGSGWASDAELAWQRTLGAHPCGAGSPPTQRLLPAYRMARNGCHDHDPVTIGFARRRALVGYQRRLAPGRLVFNKNNGSYTNTDYSRIASKLAHKHVDAHCWSFGDWASLNAEVNALYHHGTERAAGFANIGADSIELDPYTCTTLALLQARALDNDYRQYALSFAESVDTLAHEATHARGIDNEAETECYAIQLVPQTSALLDLPPKIGRLFANAMWHAYPHEPKGYATTRCRDGGPLDLHPRSPVWP
jgi:hypothetical protein